MRRVLLSLSLLILIAGCAEDVRFREDVKGLLPGYKGIDHIRYNGADDIAGTMQTAVEHWKDAKGHHVALVGAIHVGDEAYYRKIQTVLSRYDEAMFELVKPADMPNSAITNEGPDMYDPMASLFGLSAQGKIVDYRKKNFVWLDMSAEDFSRRLSQITQEHLPKILAALGMGMKGSGKRNDKEVRAALRRATIIAIKRLDAERRRALTCAALRLPPHIVRQVQKQESTGDLMGIVMRAVTAPLRIEKALYKRRGKVAAFEAKYKHMLASSSATADDAAAAVPVELPGAFGKAVEAFMAAISKVILNERDQVVIDGIAARLKAGTLKKKTAVFYGAAHLPGIGAGLKKMGFEKTRKTWLSAIAITKPSATPKKK